jgi:predicted alpha/beta superfamily hydrolase
MGRIDSHLLIERGFRSVVGLRVSGWRHGLTRKGRSTAVPAQHHQVAIPDTEMRYLSSTHVDQAYTISVALPPGYADSDQTYPALYTTDAALLFGGITQFARLNAIGKTLAPLIVIGIGYPVYWTETELYRVRDYVPAGWRQDPHSGGAQRFLRFVCEELIPWVSSEYRVDPEDRCYVGDSLGGLFGLYVLLTRPGTFSRYLIVSPGIQQDDPEVFRCERDYAANHSDLRAQVFMGVGSLEEEIRIANIHRLCQALEGRGYDGLRLTMDIFEGETHWSVIPYSICRGLRVVYE